MFGFVIKKNGWEDFKLLNKVLLVVRCVMLIVVV